MSNSKYFFAKCAYASCLIVSHGCKHFTFWLLSIEYGVENRNFDKNLMYILVLGHLIRSKFFLKCRLCKLKNYLCVILHSPVSFMSVCIFVLADWQYIFDCVCLSLFLYLPILCSYGQFVLAEKVSSSTYWKYAILKNLLYVSRSSDPFYIVTYYIKWVTSFWTHSIRNYFLLSILLVQQFFAHFINLLTI